MVDKSVSVEVTLEDTGDVKLSGDNSDFFGVMRESLCGLMPGTFDVTVVVRNECDDSDEFDGELAMACTDVLDGVLSSIECEGIETMSQANIAKRFFYAMNAACGGELCRVLEEYRKMGVKNGEEY